MYLKSTKLLRNFSYSLLQRKKECVREREREICISSWTIAPPRLRPTQLAPPTRVAAFVLIVRRMIHGALSLSLSLYGDHPRNILSSRQPYAPESLSPARRRKDTGWKLQAGNYRRDTANEGYLCSQVQKGCSACSRKNEITSVESTLQLHYNIGVFKWYILAE